MQETVKLFYFSAVQLLLLQTPHEVNQRQHRSNKCSTTIT